MNTPANLHKLAVFLQLLDNLHGGSISAKNQILKVADEEALRYLFLNHYPLEPNEIPKTMLATMLKIVFCLT